MYVGYVCVCVGRSLFLLINKEDPLYNLVSFSSPTVSQGEKTEGLLIKDSSARRTVLRGGVPRSDEDQARVVNKRSATGVSADTRAR